MRTRTAPRPSGRNERWQRVCRRFWHRHLVQYLLAVPVAVRSMHTRRWQRDRGAILNSQARNVQRLVRYAHDRVPYYRLAFDTLGIAPDTIQSAEDLAQLPLLSRDDLQDYYDALIAEGRSLRWCGAKTTSGTTGRPLLLLKPWESILEEYVGMEWRWTLTGLPRSLLRPLATNYVYISDTEYNPQFRSYALRLPALRLSTFRKYDVRKDTSDDALAVLSDLYRRKPVVVAGKPSSLARVAAMSRKHDPTDRYPLRARAVVTGAEMLLPQQRRLFEQTFHCPVYDSYGLTETDVIASECREHRGLHFRDDRLIVEIIKNGERVMPGETGEIVVTDLTNRLLPLIRYQTGDIGSVDYEACACGLAYPRLNLIEGRIVDFFTRPDGEKFNPFVLLGNLPDLQIRQYQLAQTAANRIVVRYIGNVAPDEIVQAIRPQIDRYMNPHCELITERVTTLDVVGQKTRLFVNLTNGNSG